MPKCHVCKETDPCGCTPEVLLAEMPENDKIRSSDGLHLFSRFVSRVNRRWWYDPKTGNRKERNVGEMLMLAVSELAEGMEGHRKNLQDDKLPHRSMLEVELADAIIRCLEIGEGLELDVVGALFEKMDYNRLRKDHTHEARMQGGKQY